MVAQLLSPTETQKNLPTELRARVASLCPLISTVVYGPCLLPWSARVATLSAPSLTPPVIYYLLLLLLTKKKKAGKKIRKNKNSRSSFCVEAKRNFLRGGE